MMKKSESIIVSLIFLAIILSSFGYAQDSDIAEDIAPEEDTPEEQTLEEEQTTEEEGVDDGATEERTDILDEASEEYLGETLEVDAGTTPGQFGYFIDDFFDQFGNKADTMAEKFAELKQLLSEGKKEEAKVALENFREYAKKLQEEASPEDRDKIRKYMAAINHELTLLKSQGNDDIISKVEDSARSTLNALELSKIIQDACGKLIELSASNVDAELQFNNLCKPSEDSSKWHKKYYEALTQEQQEEVKRFVKEIKQCFKNPASCDCSAATDNQAFVNNCEMITKAEVDCRDGDESACKLSEDLGKEIFQSLEDKPYLREALKEIEREFSDMEDDRFDNHMPPECIDAGATDRQSCMKIMIEQGNEIPEECKAPLKAAIEKGETNERNLREICEATMFDLDAQIYANSKTSVITKTVL